MPSVPVAQSILDIYFIQGQKLVDHPIRNPRHIPTKKKKKRKINSASSSQEHIAENVYSLISLAQGRREVRVPFPSAVCDDSELSSIKVEATLKFENV